MENENKRCYNCRNLQRYYTKGIRRFDKTKIGRCCQKQCIVNADDSCSDFERKPKYRRYDRLVKHTLCDILTEISEIRMYLETESDGNEKL